MRAWPPERRLKLAAAAALGLVLVVVIASAAIRLSDGALGELLPVVRATHRISASIATLVVFALAWLAWRSGRRTLAGAVVTVTALLSIVGALTGISPPPPAAATNLLGGLLLVALLAAVLGGGFSWLAAALLAQAALGAWLSIYSRELWSWPLLMHAFAGVTLAALLVRAAKDVQASGLRVLLAVLALAVPAAGVASFLFDLALAATLAHAAAAALLIAAASAALPRRDPAGAEPWRHPQRAVALDD
jgi:heme A synthase